MRGGGVDLFSLAPRPVFAPTLDSRRRAVFLKAYQSKVNVDLITPPSLEEVAKSLKLTHDTSPGPDGVSFAAWRAAPDLAATVLWDALRAVLNGQLPPEGFNHGLLFLLPKKLTGLIADTRPLSVTNTDNRILAACVARCIMGAVDDYVHPSQKGFVAGRQGADHVSDINERFYEAVKKKENKLLFLLDTAKAFDSIDHDWVSHVLVKVGFPPWFRNFVRGSLSSVKVAPFFGAELTEWIDIERGVKQGCPLSPLLFVIAYDPLLVYIAGLTEVELFAFADDLALFADSVPLISKALLEITRFSEVSGLGVNRDKSVAVPTGDPSLWGAIKEELKSCPWPSLPLSDKGTHLGILIGREVTLGQLWAGPTAKAEARLRQNKTLIASLPLSSRMLYINVFIVSLFSYIALFFILPEELWKSIRELIRRFFPFNGGAYFMDELVCARQLYGVKPPLKDVWAFNISLLAVRSKFFPDCAIKYSDLPLIDVRYNMSIKDHRDCAAVDFWMFSHEEDGTLVPPSPPTSSQVYKILVKGVYEGKATARLGKKVHDFVKEKQPNPPPPTFSSSLSTIILVSFFSRPSAF